MMYSWLVISALLNGLAQIVWKKSSIVSIELLSLLQNKYFIGGCVLYVISIGIWLFFLSKTEVSKAYPILSLSYIVVLIGGIFLGEHVTLGRILGVSCILIGVFIVSRT